MTLYQHHLKSDWIRRKSFPGLMCPCGNDQAEEDPHTWLMSKSRYYAVMNPEHHADFHPHLDHFYCPICLSTWSFHHPRVVEANTPEVINKCEARISGGKHAMVWARVRKKMKKGRWEE